MAMKSYKAVVPGSLMLFGEHAVLHGSHAIVTAIENYLTVTLTPRIDKIININSELLGKYQFSLDDFKITSRFNFVLAAIGEYLRELPCGFDLEISSDFTDKIGFGSSAAVTVGTLRVFDNWLHDEQLSAYDLVKIGRKVVQKAQSTGSGADIAASVCGKTLLYQMEPLNIQELAHKPPLRVVYSGIKKATSEVVQMVEAKRLKNMEIFRHLYAAIDCCVLEAADAINHQNWSRLGELMNIHHGIQDAFGTNNEALSKIVFSLRQQADIYGAKISGAGLGDCVIGVEKISFK